MQEYTRKKIADFLHSHTAYELIPESGKVVVLDADLPMRQAFHALHEQVLLGVRALKTREYLNLGLGLQEYFSQRTFIVRGYLGLVLSRW
jgi:hypothetical protein